MRRLISLDEINFLIKNTGEYFFFYLDIRMRLNVVHCAKRDKSKKSHIGPLAFIAESN